MSLPTKVEREEGLRNATLQAVGVPENYIRTDIIQIGDVNHYRVNIYAFIESLQRPKITDSYYVTITDKGWTSNPPMKLKYCNDKMLDELVVGRRATIMGQIPVLV